MTTTTRSKYTVSVVHSGGTIQLTDGEPHDAVVFRNLYNMYSFRLGSETSQVKVTLSPHYGDPDLYIKIDNDPNFPASALDYQYSSYSDRYHDDQVVIPEGQVCVNCFMSIAVYGFTGSGYSIRVSTEDVTTTLQLGRPFKESVLANSTQFFKVTPANDGPVEVTLTQISGIVDLAVSFLDHTPFDGSPGCAGNSCYFNNYGRVGLVPQITTDAILPNTDVFIGVTGVSTAMFTVQARSPGYNTTVNPTTGLPKDIIFNELLDGVPQDDTLLTDSDTNYNNDDVKFYAMRLDLGHKDLKISTQSRTGTLKLFVTYCSQEEGLENCKRADRLPSESNHLAASLCDQNFGEINLERNDTSPGAYLIAVRSCPWQFASSFSITASVQDTILQLQLGRSVRDFSAFQTYTMFKVYVSNPKDELYISITCLSGDADMYVSTNPDVNKNADHHIWEQTRYGSDGLTIFPDDPNHCNNCYYFIAIYGFEESTYRILAQMKNDEPTVLMIGEPQSDHVGESGVNFYSITYPKSNQGESLSIQITPSFGDPDIFVLVSTVDGAEARGRPNFNNYDYYSLQNSQQEDRVSIATGSSRFESLCNEPVCLLSVAIIGYHDADYIITATASTVITSLVPDVPFQGIVRPGSYDYFITTASDQDKNLKITLR